MTRQEFTFKQKMRLAAELSKQKGLDVVLAAIIVTTTEGTSCSVLTNVNIPREMVALAGDPAEHIGAAVKEYVHRLEDLAPPERLPS